MCAHIQRHTVHTKKGGKTSVLNGSGMKATDEDKTLGLW